MTKMLQNDEICQMHELCTNGEVTELSLDDLDQASGGIGPALFVLGVFGAGVVAGVAAAGLGFYIGMKLSGGHITADA